MKYAAACLFIALINTTLLLSWGLSPDKPNYKVYGDSPPVKIVKIYDGDTIKVDIEGWPPIIGKNIGVRVYGIDAPEMHDKNEDVRQKAQEAKAFATEVLTNAKVVKLTDLGRDKYFRILAKVWADDVNLADLMLEAHLAKPYDCGTKDVWTEDDVKGE